MEAAHQQGDGRDEDRQVEDEGQNKADERARARRGGSACRNGGSCTAQNQSEDLNGESDDAQYKGDPPVFTAAGAARECGVLLEETLDGCTNRSAVVRSPQRRLAGL